MFLITRRNYLIIKTYEPTPHYQWLFIWLYRIISIDRHLYFQTDQKKKKRPITPLLKLQDYHKCVNYLVFAAKQMQQQNFQILLSHEQEIARLLFIFLTPRNQLRKKKSNSRCCEHYSFTRHNKQAGSILELFKFKPKKTLSI